MSIATEIMNVHQDAVDTVTVNKNAELNGEAAVQVVAHLKDGRTVAGTFTSHPRSGFGGIEFSGPKDITTLMIKRIQSVLDGTYERGVVTL
jgi:hypothetical protein